VQKVEDVERLVGAVRSVDHGRNVGAEGRAGEGSRLQGAGIGARYGRRPGQGQGDEDGIAIMTQATKGRVLAEGFGVHGMSVAALGTAAACSCGE
jgi:hypothetical protein